MGSSTVLIFITLAPIKPEVDLMGFCTGPFNYTYLRLQLNI